MLPTQPTLHMLCGKIAAGKSTLAAHLAERDNAVLIAEDDWLGVLFGDQMSTGQDFMRCSARLRGIMGPHLVSLLTAGVSVVLDFQANTPDSRAWMRDIVEQTGADHQLHVLMPPDEVCLSRLRARNRSGKHPFVVTEEQFHRFMQYVSPPSPDEGFTIVMHTDGAMP